jgi:hypothetical protein
MASLADPRNRYSLLYTDYDLWKNLVLEGRQAVGMLVLGALRGNFEFSSNLGLETADDLVELRFGVRHPSRKGVHLLGSQDQEPQQKHQQKFCAKAHRILSLIVVVNGDGGWLGLFFHG